MKAVYTECVIPLNDCNPIYGENRIIIRVEDNAAGPYLLIRGYNDDPGQGEAEHDFFLCNDAEIDFFAAACKAMLKQANEANNTTTLSLNSVDSAEAGNVKVSGPAHE